MTGKEHADVDCLSRAPVDLPCEVDDKCIYPTMLIVPTDELEWLKECDEDEAIKAINQMCDMGDGSYKRVNNLI